MQLHEAAVGGGAREFEAALASSSLVGVVVVTRGVRSSKSCMSDARPSRVAPTLLPATAPIFGEKKNHHRRVRIWHGSSTPLYPLAGSL